jgi:hypothetical protein
MNILTKYPNKGIRLIPKEGTEEVMAMVEFIKERGSESTLLRIHTNWEPSEAKALITLINSLPHSLKSIQELYAT